MKLTTQHILELLDSLEKGVVYDYVSSKTSKVALKTVDYENKTAFATKITKNNPEGQDTKFSSRMFEILESGVEERKPFSIDVIFNNSGSARSALEALLIRTSEFYTCMVGKNKHIVWLPSEPHEIGAIVSWESIMAPPSADDLKEAFHRYLLEQFPSTDTGNDYWKIAINPREETLFKEEIIMEVTEGRTDNLFEVYNNDEATLVYKKALIDPRNKFQNGIVSAMLGKYKDFLRDFYMDRHRELSPTNAPMGPLQIIYYGAPGTGKSHLVKTFFEDNSIPKTKVFRTTFHPDTDYAAFVGCYKPTPIIDVVSKQPTQDFTYEFTPQVFTKAYVEAWTHPEEDVYLVIEEINRGNCAQIFGDLFQLLDRDDKGESKYEIDADNDLAMYLRKEDQLGYDNEGIRDGKLKLPGKMHIWATMNTSDQSLFPIDSAFKRRWEWEYVAVNYLDAEQFTLKISDLNMYNWGQFLRGLNNHIKREIHNTNKILGNRFVQAGADKIISAKAFRDKVLFFLFNDVFKDDDDFKSLFFGEDAENKFFEDLCVTNDTELTIKFIENTCQAKNLVTPDATAGGDFGGSADPSASEESPVEATE